MATFTAANIVAEIKGRNATLSQIIHLDDFAAPDQLADELAREFKGDLKPTQLRKVFDSIKDIARSLKGRKGAEPLTSDDRSQILPLLPQLAYARGRDLIPKKFYDLMSLALSSSKMKTVADFERLDEFLTAILAYQKFHEHDRAGR